MQIETINNTELKTESSSGQLAPLVIRHGILNTILKTDCLDTMESLPSHSINLLATDPPYFLPAKHYQTRKEFRRNFGDLGILEGYFREWFKQVERILKEDGTLYMFCDGQSYPLFYYYAYFFSKNVRPIIWDKKTSFSGYGWRHQHELILWAEMPEAKPIPTGDGDIIRIPAVKVDLRKHPAEKPEELMKLLIEKSSKEGDTVYDPFCGSGTTCAVAKSLKRNWLGNEIEEEYWSYANKRCAEMP